MANPMEILIKSIQEGEPYDEPKLNEICENAGTEGYVFNVENGQKFGGISTGTGLEGRFMIPIDMGARMIFQIGYYEPGCFMTEHWHPYSEEVWIVAQGEGRIRLSSVDKKIDNWFELKVGSVVYIPPGIVHSYELTGKEKIVFIGAMAPPDLECYQVFGFCEDQVEQGPYPWKECKIIQGPLPR